MKQLFRKSDIRNKYWFRKMAFSMLGSPLIVENPVYQYLYNLKINRRIDTFNIMPPAVQIETTSFCNAKCVMCPQGQLTRKQGTMDMDLYYQIIDECADWNVPFLHLCGIGETMLDKDIFKRIRYAKRKRIGIVRTNTNASLLNAEAADELLNSGLDELFISIDHGNKDEYEAIRKNLDFEEVCENIEYIVKRRQQLGKTKPSIGINAVAQEGNLEQVRSVYDRFGKLVDYINFQASWNWTGDIKTNGTPITNRKVKRFPCPYPWLYLNIKWDGEVSICCVDYDSKVKIVNVRDMSLKDAWFSESFNKLRLKHIKREFDDILTCGVCDNYPNWWIRY